METLSKRLRDTFQNIQYNSYTPLEVEQISEKWAEEIKNICIEFAVWKWNQPKRIIKLSDYPDTVNAEEIYRIELEKEFEQFIEEYYE